MGYVIAGYVIVGTLLASYAVALVVRRRHLLRAVERLNGPAAGPGATPSPSGASS